MPDSEDLPSYEEFENLFVNNAHLERISAYLNRFNPIKVMRVQDKEIRHSNILAWLMNPNENHGLGDSFLKAFLAAALQGQSAMGEPTSLDILSSDLRDVEIKREWKHIDIFIYSEQNEWAFIIENKFRSTQSEGQLPRYWKVVEDHFKQMKKTDVIIRGIFLMIDEEAEDDRYVPITYENVADILSQLIARKKQELGQEASIFLQHYLDILMEEAGMSEEQEKLQELARELYRSHKKVLDFIQEHGDVVEFYTAIGALFEADSPRNILSEYTFFKDSAFLPNSWIEKLGGINTKWAGCEKWHSKFPLTCCFLWKRAENGLGGTITLSAAVVSISDLEFRKSLIQKIKEKGSSTGLTVIKFQNGADANNRKFSQFFSKSESVKSVKSMDDADEIEAAMKELLIDFKSTFDAIAEILPEFARYADKE